jgi:hypothetical protein
VCYNNSRYYYKLFKNNIYINLINIYYYHIYNAKIIKMPNDTKCSICNDQISIFRYKAMKQWNIQGYLCSNCYSKKLREHYIPTYIIAKEDKINSK